MSPARLARFILLIGMLGFYGFAPTPASGQTGERFPSKEEVADLLAREPIILQSWPVWQQRLLAWINDPNTGTDESYKQAYKFLRETANAHAELPESFAADALAYHLLGDAYLHGADLGLSPDPANAEKAYRRSIQIDARFAQPHRNLAV